MERKLKVLDVGIDTFNMRQHDVEKKCESLEFEIAKLVPIKIQN